jgi:hypothetical protein
MMALPFVGWLISFVFSFFLAIPFYFLWNHVAHLYFKFLPDYLMVIPFWDCVWLFLTISCLKIILVPHGLISSSATVKKDD